MFAFRVSLAGRTNVPVGLPCSRWDRGDPPDPLNTCTGFPPIFDFFGQTNCLFLKSTRSHNCENHFWHFFVTPRLEDRTNLCFCFVYDICFPPLLDWLVSFAGVAFYPAAGCNPRAITFSPVPSGRRSTAGGLRVQCLCRHGDGLRLARHGVGGANRLPAGSGHVVTLCHRFPTRKIPFLFTQCHFKGLFW